MVLLFTVSMSTYAGDCREIAKGLPDIGKAFAKLQNIKKAQVSVEPIHQSKTAFKLVLENTQSYRVYQVNFFDYQGTCSLLSIEDKGEFE